MADIVGVMVFFFLAEIESLLVTGDFKTKIEGERERRRKICHPCCLLDFGITSGAAPRCWRLGLEYPASAKKKKKKDKGR